MANHRAHIPGATPGFVYLIRRGPYYKIGHTNNLKNRLGSVNNVITPRAARNFSIELVWSLECKDLFTTERALHQHVVEYHCLAEWFLLPIHIAEWITHQTEESICRDYNPSSYRRLPS